MITSAQLHKNLYSILKLAYKGSVTLKVSWKKEVYLLTLEHTDEIYTPRTNRKHKRPNKRKPPALVKTEKCMDCGYFKVNGTCINKKCDSNTSRPVIPQ